MSAPAERAKQIIADPVFKTAVAMARGECVGRWAAPKNTTEDRENAYWLFRAIEEVEAQLQAIADNADFEEYIYG